MLIYIHGLPCLHFSLKKKKTHELNSTVQLDSVSCFNT